MIGAIIAAVVAVFVVVGFLMADWDGPRSSGKVTQYTFASFILIVLIALLWGGGIASFVGCVCVVLKLLGVEPVNSWTWFQAFLPLIGGIVAEFIGLMIKEALR